MRKFARRFSFNLSNGVQADDADKTTIRTIIAQPRRCYVIKPAYPCHYHIPDTLDDDP